MMRQDFKDSYDQHRWNAALDSWPRLHRMLELELKLGRTEAAERTRHRIAELARDYPQLTKPMEAQVTPEIMTKLTTVPTYPDVQSALYPRALFVYSGYWRKWSRVLRFHQPWRSDMQVEVDMQPLIEDRVINIRCHRTLRVEGRDRYERLLPGTVYGEMVARVGVETANRLCHEDFLPQIDFGLYSILCVNGGGVEFDKIKTHR